MTETVFANTLISPLMGALITGTEFAIGGFGAGVGGAIGAGKGVGEVFAAGGIGALMGFGIGAVAGYTYTAGWQSFIHGANTQLHNQTVIQRQINQWAEYNNLLRQGKYDVANKLLQKIQKEQTRGNWFYKWVPEGSVQTTPEWSLESMSPPKSYVSSGYVGPVTGKFRKVYHQTQEGKEIWLGGLRVNENATQHYYIKTKITEEFKGGVVPDGPHSRSIILWEINKKP